MQHSAMPPRRPPVVAPQVQAAGEANEVEREDFEHPEEALAEGQPEAEAWAWETFTEQQVADWKAQYGSAIEAKLIGGIEFVFRGLRRGEHNTIIPSDFAGTREQEEDKIVCYALLWPKLTEGDLGRMAAGVVSNIYADITRLSGYLPQGQAFVPGEFTRVPGRTPEERLKYMNSQLTQGWPKLFPGQSLPTQMDVNNWISRGMPLGWSAMEGMLFVQVAQTRPQFRKFREKIQKNQMSTFAWQEQLAGETVLWPYPKQFNPTSDDFLSGTIRQLSDRALLLAEFESDRPAVKL